ncbi:MAG: amino acid--tRNA ligase-related protein, partial [Gammaproteobacteria bacterium]
DRSTILDALFADLMLRAQSTNEAVFVCDFPIEQAAYARLDPGPPARAQRFELVIGGIEIANGYYEVVDLAEQQARLRQENVRRRELVLPEVLPDPLFLAALESGLPSCAGVALGVDRLVMLYLQADSVAASVSFDPFRMS